MEWKMISKSNRHSLYRPISILILSCFLLACSSQNPYEEAVGLIKQRKYTEAKEVLNTIPMGDSLAEKAKLAIVVCNIGLHYESENYRFALRSIDSGVVRDDTRYYVLNYPPSDPLYSHVATLSMLVYANIVTEQIQGYLDSEVNQDNLQWYRGTNHDPQIMWNGVMKTYSEDDQYQEEDVDAYYGGSLTDPPFIRSVKFDKLNPPEEFKNDAEAIKTKMNEFQTLIENKKEQFNELELALSSMDGDSFFSNTHAMSWLTGGTGGWISIATRYNSDYGVYTRSAVIFKASSGDEHGQMTMGNVTAETGRDVGRISEGYFEINYTDGNTIHMSVGDVGKEMTMVRTSADRALFNGLLEMARVTKE